MAASTEVASSWWLDKARALTPIVEQYWEEGEQERRLPRPIFEAMRKAGFFRMWVPKAFGGDEVDPETALRVFEEVSRQDGSAGWNLMIGVAGGVLAAFMAEKAARDIFSGGPDTVLAGAVVVRGRATPVDGGYRVSGRWPLASGIQQADWVFGSCQIVDEEGPRLGPGGTPIVHRVFLPTSDCTILDTWQTAGLRATGSHDFQAENVFVPEERCSPAGAPAVQPGVLYSAGIQPLWWPIVAAVALGIARDATETFVELAKSKTPFRSQSLLIDQTTTQATVADAEARLRAGRAFLFETIRSAWSAMSASRPLSDEQRALISLSTPFAARSAVEAVDLLFTAAGSSSIYTSSRLERCFRNVHMVTQHIAASPRRAMEGGGYFLGLGLRPWN